MFPHVECAGAPRDLGVDQGRRCVARVREACGRSGGGAHSLRARISRFVGGAPVGGEALRGLQRDLTCHFPQLAERTAGIARGAGVTLESLIEAFGRETFPEVGAWRAVRSNRAPSAPAMLEAWLAVEGSAGSTAFVLRTSRPESGYESLALTRPWLAGSVCGVNSAGLGGAWGPRAGARFSTSASRRDAGARSESTRAIAPPWLLLESCLERLDRVEQALLWCERRSAGSMAGEPFQLVFADGNGAIGAIEWGSSGPRRCEVEEQLEDAPGAEPADAGERRGRGRLRVRLEPGKRALRVVSGEGACLSRDLPGVY